MDIQASLRNLPSVERVLEDGRIARRINLLSRRGITGIVRECIDRERRSIREGTSEGSTGPEALLSSIVESALGVIDELAGDRTRRAVNATGVILHTNLGRAPLGKETAGAILEAASHYCDLEMDLAGLERVSRQRRVTRLLRSLTGAEDALVVNNNAAAVTLAVNTFAAGGAVAISRGELVEIGGSFRLPEILRAAAAEVMEVGTTNRTHIGDYEKAVDEGATMLLKVHTSNYRVLGYTSEVSLEQMVALGRERNVPVMYDQGSGILFPLEERGVKGEESILPLLDTGADLISFSADKVLGGPQAGIVLGTAATIGRMRKNHLARALRTGKLTLAGLEQVLVHYWNGEFEKIPALRMITAEEKVLRERCERLAERLEEATGVETEVIDGESSVGGGSFPINPLPAPLLRINLPSGRADRLARLMRKMETPVLARVRDDSMLIDLRTVAEDEEDSIVSSIERGSREINGRK